MQQSLDSGNYSDDHHHSLRNGNLQTRRSPSPLYRRDVHAHYDRLLFCNLNVSFIRETHQLNFYKFRFIVRVDGQQWEIQRSSADLVDLDEQLHFCTFTRRHSNLPVLSAEKFALAETQNKRDRQRRQLEIRDTLDNFMKRLSSLLESESMRISCLNILQFFEVNNKGEHDGNPVPSSGGQFVERVDKNPGSYFQRIRRTFCSEPECSRHGKVFGVDLARHTIKLFEPVPCILTDCTTFIENNLTRGIYRISSVTSQTASIREVYNNKKGAHYDFAQVSTDIHSVACLLKMYFRMLPRKLFCGISNSEINALIKSAPIEKQIRNARELTKRLSPSHFRTAAYLMRHLSFIAEKSSVTNMNAANLALVWSPNLFKIKSTRDQMTNMNSQNVLIEVMIRWYKEIFYEIGPTRDMDLLADRCNGNNLPLNSNNNNNNCIESSDGGDEEDSDCKSSNALVNGNSKLNSFIPRDHQRVRSEEPPGRSIVVQVKQNLKNFGSNLKTSFRNLVSFHNRNSSSSSSLSNSSMEFFARTSNNQKFAIDNSTASLNMGVSPVDDSLIRSEPCRASTNSAGSSSGYTAISSPSRTYKNGNVAHAPKAELDAMSMDSLPFEASRYDNLELVQRRGSIQHKRLIPNGIHKKST